VADRQKLILKRLHATPLRRWQLVGSNVLMRLLIAVVQTAIIVGVGSALYHVQIAGSWLLIGALILLGSLGFIALGYVIASFASTEDAANGMTSAVQFPLMFLSGTFFPIDAMPDALKTVARALPLTYLGDGLRQVMVDGTPFAPLWVCFAFLAVWLVVCFGMGTSFRSALSWGVAATSVELTPTYEDQAAELLADQGLAGRAPRVVADLLASPDAVPEADVVLLNRVVCCTERPAELLAVAARHAGERLVFSFPRDVWWLRSAQRTVNLLARVLGWDWRFRVYHPGDLFAAVTDAGLRLDRTEHGRVWQVALLVRSAGCVQARLS